jgi:long-chain acyl-CoA synthetase
MLYSSGTTGRPKGILRPLPEEPPKHNLPLFDFLTKLWHYREGMIYLSPAPLYHSALQAAVNLTIRMGGTVIIMETFDPERYLQLVEQWGITHSQLVPTMFSRMLV